MRIPGRCLRCQAPIRAVVSTYTHGPLAGTPSATGALLPEGTRVRFRLARGSTVDLEFCTEHANALTPADFPAIWRAVIEYEDLVIQLRGPHGPDGVTLLPRAENQRRLWLAHLSRTFLLGRVAAFVDEPGGVRRVDPRVAV